MSPSIYYTDVEQIISSVSFITSSTGSYPTLNISVSEGYYSFFKFDSGASPKADFSVVHMSAGDTATNANYSGYPFAIIQYASNPAE